MRKLLSAVALSCAMAVAAGMSISIAEAAPVSNAVQSLKVEQTSASRKHTIIGIIGITVIIGIIGIIGAAGGITVTATAAGGRTSALDWNRQAPGLQPRRFMKLPPRAPARAIFGPAYDCIGNASGPAC